MDSQTVQTISTLVAVFLGIFSFAWNARNGFHAEQIQEKKDLWDDLHASYERVKKERDQLLEEKADWLKREDDYKVRIKLLENK